MVRKFLKHFALFTVSLPGLFCFNLLLLAINTRLVLKIMTTYSSGGFLETDLFTDFCESVAIRMVTIGVLILERNEVLEMTGKISSHEDYDPLTKQSQPYGMFYLCGGLIMECFVEHIKHPIGLFESHIQHEFMIIIVLLFTVTSCVISIYYTMELVGFIFNRRKPAHSDSVEG